MLHPGQVISRQRLLSEVWGFDFDPRSNVVDVCVRRLRRQLGPDAPIETRAQRRLPRSGMTASAPAGRLRGLTGPGPRLQVELLWAAFAATNYAAHDRVAELGDDPVPLRMDQPDAGSTGSAVWALRPTLIVLGVRDGAHRVLDRAGRLPRHPAVGRAVRGAADGGHVPGHGVARPAAGRRAATSPSSGPRSAGRCSSARSASSTTPRTSCARR